MELDTLWSSIAEWAIAIALLSPFLIIGFLTEVVLIIALCLSVGCVCGVIIWIVNLILSPFGKRLFVDKTAEKQKNKGSTDCFGEKSEDGVHSEDTD